MAAHTRIESESETRLWDLAAEEVNSWRGRALHAFSSVEAAVSETLLNLDELIEPSKGCNRQPAGRRFQELSDAISPSGPFASEGEHARAALEDFRELDGLRAFLVHGEIKIVMDRHAHWLLIIKLLKFSGNSHERLLRVYSQQEAKTTLLNLESCSRILRSRLQSINAVLKSRAA